MSQLWSLEGYSRAKPRRLMGGFEEIVRCLDRSGPAAATNALGTRNLHVAVADEYDLTQTRFRLSPSNKPLSTMRVPFPIEEVSRSAARRFHQCALTFTLAWAMVEPRRSSPSSTVISRRLPWSPLAGGPGRRKDVSRGGAVSFEFAAESRSWPCDPPNVEKCCDVARFLRRAFGVRVCGFVHEQMVSGA